MSNTKNKENTRIEDDVLKASEKEPLSKFSMDHDMRPIYRQLYKKYGEFPEIVVFEQLEGNQTIAHNTMFNGRRLIYVKDEADQNLIERICKEIESPSSEPSDIPCLWYDLDYNEVALWCMYAVYIADVLDIALPQILFSNGDEISGYSEELPMIISDTLCEVEMLVTIAHELRHRWQHVNHPDWFEAYIHPEKDESAYLSQIAEIDAEAFGIKIESMITGVDFINSIAGQDLSPEYRNAIIKQMNEIDVILSQKKIKEIRKIIHLDEIFKRALEGVSET